MSKKKIGRFLVDVYENGDLEVTNEDKSKEQEIESKIKSIEDAHWEETEDDKFYDEKYKNYAWVVTLETLVKDINIVNAYPSQDYVKENSMCESYPSAIFMHRVDARRFMIKMYKALLKDDKDPEIIDLGYGRLTIEWTEGDWSINSVRKQLKWRMVLTEIKHSLDY